MKIKRRLLIDLLFLIVLAAFFCFFCRPDRGELWKCLAIYLALYFFLIYKNEHGKLFTLDVQALVLYIALLALCIVMRPLFFTRALHTPPFKAIVSYLSLDRSVMASFVSWVLFGILVVGLYPLSVSVLNKWRKGATIFLILFLSFWQLQFSMNLEFTAAFSYRVDTFIMNMLPIFALFLLLNLIIRRWHISLIVSSLICTLISITNHYVILFHGSPLFPSELASTATAFNVLSGYRLEITSTVIYLVLFFLVQLLFLLSLRFCPEKQVLDRSNNRFKRELLAFGVIIAILYITVFSPLSIRTILRWNWPKAVQNYGYNWCAMCDLKTVFHPLNTVDGYSADKITVSEQTDDTISYRSAESSAEYPDIILILNESFCDLEEYLDTGADVDYLAEFRSIPDAVFGRTACSILYGGTNNSEFEYLTSNSAYLLPTFAPFNFLSMAGMDCSIVSYLETLGYETTAMHCMDPTNYNRNTAYADLGFDNIIMGAENFTFNYYGNRKFLDADNYKDLISHYEQGSDGPRFFYMLTFQNHGSYDQNDSEWDQVHVSTDYGLYTDQFDEYLTSVHMSSQAISELISYFSAQSRPVILCMMGDHPPSILLHIPEEKASPKENSRISLRTVPFMLWSNCGVEFPEDLDHASMVDIVPILLKSANMPLTPYYQTIYDLHETIPLRLSSGLYMDKDGVIGKYGTDSPYYDILTNYFYMEYNAVSRGKDYRKELFVLDESP